jgi:mannose-6-phosphate isomerase-like protein (cupin superfamily)
MREYRRTLAPVYSDVTGPAHVLGVHGAAGLTFWKYLAGRRDMRGEWEAIEWASIPPGGLSGEHRHTRTEEIYFVLSGQGEFLINGEARPARPRSLLLTGRGAVHGLRNTGPVHLDWLVIELPVPEVSAVLRGDSGGTPGIRAGLDRGDGMARIYDMGRQRSVDPREILTGPLSALRIVALPAAEERRISARTTESAWFVLTGSGSVTSGTARAPLRAGCCVALPLGTEATLVAGSEGLELFQAELAVPGD